MRGRTLKIVKNQGQLPRFSGIDPFVRNGDHLKKATIQTRNWKILITKKFGFIVWTNQNQRYLIKGNSWEKEI